AVVGPLVRPLARVQPAGEDGMAQAMEAVPQPGPKGGRDATRRVVRPLPLRPTYDGPRAPPEGAGHPRSVARRSAARGESRPDVGSPGAEEPARRRNADRHLARARFCRLYESWRNLRAPSRVRHG